MKFTDRQLLDMAVQCLKHARQSTAIRDCQCAACRGFMEQSEELLATIEQPTPETAVGCTNNGKCRWLADAINKCQYCRSQRG